ncbi:MAG TPA: hypothetical protein VFJ84_02355 [Candidatus Saccharimonadales bacterium]|nr:hypothetical protein [Candidatus Saccharimonadales bacterium]
MILNKHFNLKYAAGALHRRHHLSNQNTLEIVLTLLFVSVIYRLLAFLSREARY